MHREEYKQYLQSDHWKNLKAKKLKGIKKCWLCPNKLGLELHHIEYRNIYDVTTSDLRALCPSCHERWHAIELDMKFKYPSFRRSPEMLARKVKRLNRQIKAVRRGKKLSRHRKQSFLNGMQAIKQFREAYSVSFPSQ